MQHPNEPDAKKLEDAAVILDKHLFLLEAEHVRKAIQEIKRLKYQLVIVSAKTNSILF